MHSTFKNLKQAQNNAKDIAQEYDTKSNIAGMKSECPIFEMSQGNVIKAHFQGNQFAEEFLRDYEPVITCCGGSTSQSCTIL